MSEQAFKENVIQDSAVDFGSMKLFFLRRGSGTFPQELENRMKALSVKTVHHVAQSESDGNISISVFYS